MRQPVQVQQLTLDRRIHGKERHAGPHADLAVGAAEIVIVQRLSPVRELAQHVRNHFHAADRERQVEFLPGDFAIALRAGTRHGRCQMWFPGQVAELGQVGRIGRGLLDQVLRVANVAMLVPGHAVAQDRLAKPVVIEPRQPVRLGVEVVEPHLAIHAPRGVVADLVQFQVGRGVFELVPLLLEILLLEVVIADQSQLAGHAEVVGQVPAIARDHAPAPGALLGQQVAAIQTQVVVAVVVNSPGVEQAESVPGNAEQAGPIERERRAQRPGPRRLR